VKEIITYYSIFVTLGFLVLLALFSESCNDAEYNKQLNEQNIQALTDSIQTLTLDNGQLQSQKAIFFTDKKNLEKLNKDLKEELDRVKGGKPEVIIKTDVKYVGFDLKLNNELLRLEDGSLGLKFDYDTKSRSLQGISKFKVIQQQADENTPGKVNIIPGITEITKDEISFALTVGIKKESDGTRNIFVIPSDTTLRITELVGANLGKEPIPKKRHFGFGPSLQVGYDIVNQRPALGVGLSLQYNLIKF
jgi:hypothetical protein